MVKKSLVLLNIIFFSIVILSLNLILAFHTSSPSDGSNYFTVGTNQNYRFNITLNNSNPGSSGNITVVSITLPQGFVYKGTNGTNVNGTFTNSTSTNALNWTNTTAGKYLINGSQNNSYFWFNATVTSTPGVYNITVTSINNSGADSYSNNITVNVTDVTPPTITIIYPQNASYIDVTTLNYNVSDNGELGFCWRVEDELNFNFSSIPALNKNFTVVTAEGSRSLRVYCNDSAGNINSSIVYFTKDATSPTITVVNPTNLGYISGSSVRFNLTSDEPLSYCNISLNYGPSYDMTLNSSKTGANFTNFTMPSSGFFTARFWCNDTAGNFDDTQYVSFTMDSVNPLLNLTSPENTTYYSDVVTLNYTYSDDNPASCWYSNNSGVWNSLTAPASTEVISITSKEGANNIILYCNDSAGNMNSSNLSFFKDTTNPNLNITKPVLYANQTSFTVLVNLTVSDLTLNRTYINISYTNGTDVNSTTNYTNLGYITDSLIVPADGIYQLTVTSVDNGGRQNASNRTLTVDSTSPVITIISPINGTNYYTNQSVALNFIATDYLLPTYRWYNLNGTNISFMGLINIRYNDSYIGMNNITFYANDSVNNKATPVIVFINITNTPDTSIIPNDTNYNVTENITNIIVDYNSTIQNITHTNTTKEVTIDLSQLKNNNTVTMGSNDFTLVTTGTYSYSAFIPAGINITGVDGWDGKITLPTINTSTTEFGAPSGTTQVVVEMGSTNEITFSSPVKITIGNMAGNHASWTRGNNTLIDITTVCDSTTNPTNIDAITTRECYIDDTNSIDLIIWTYHFTTFAAYAPYVAPGNSGGSSNSGTSGGSSTSTYTLKTSELVSGYTKDLLKGDKVKFILANKNITVVLSSVIDSYVKLDFAGTEKTINLGKVDKTDIDGDGTYDLSIDYLSYNNVSKRGKLTFKKISEAITKATVTPTPSTTPAVTTSPEPVASQPVTPTPAEKESDNSVLISTLIIVVAVIVIGFMFYFSYRKHKKKKHRDYLATLPVY